MSRNSLVRVIGIAAIVLGLAQMPLGAVQQGQQGQQGQAQPSYQPPANEPARVQVKLVVDRVEGQKVVNSIPFELLVKAGPRSSPTTLNHGRSVAVPQTTFLPLAAGGVAIQPQTSYVYQSIGSNISVSDMTVTDKLITFLLMIDISTLDPAPNAAVPGSQSFKKYSMQSPIVVRPAEPTVVVVSNDQIAGETVRLTVTATVMR